MGSPSFVGLDVARSMPSGLVFELAAQHRPARVEDGLRHLGLRELGRADISDDDKFVLASELGAPLVKMVAPSVGDLGVDRADAALVPGALRNGERSLVLAVMAKRRDRGPVAACGKRLEAEIDADLAVASRTILGNLALETDVPATTSVLHEAASLELAVDVAGLPEVELALEVDDVPAVDFHGAGNKRHPAKGTLRAAAGSKSRAPLVEVSRGGELAADRLHGIGVQTQVGTASGAELDQIECGRPAHLEASLPAPLGLTLSGDAEVPNLVACPGMAVEVLPRRRVLDTIFECEHHASEHNWSEGKMQDYRTGRHCVFKMHVHLVFVTKYRRDVLSGRAIDDLRSIFGSVCKDFEAELVECNGEDDHVHLLVAYPPKVSISALVNSLKGVSSRFLRQWRPEVSGRYYKGVLWSPSYFAASCGGAPLSIIKQYVEQQREAAPPPRPKRRGFRRGEN